jgi:hypothetical protein
MRGAVGGFVDRLVGLYKVRKKGFKVFRGFAQYHAGTDNFFGQNPVLQSIDEWHRAG